MSELLHNQANKSPLKRGVSPAAFSIGMLLGLLTACMFVLVQHKNLPVVETVQSAEIDETVLLIEQAMQQVSSDYIDEISPQELAQAALDGMFTKLDRHSKYLDEETYQDLVHQTHGEYLGIGIEIESEDNAIRITSVMDETPAAKIGLLQNDLITAVNGKDLQHTDAEILLDEIRYSIDSVLSLSIQRQQDDEPKELNVQLTRDVIEIESVESFLISNNTSTLRTASLNNQSDNVEGIVYVRLKQFNEHTATDLEQLLNEYLASEKSLYGLILDLRNNPGGLVTSAVDVADLFLDSGTIVSADGRAKDADFIYKANPGESFADIPLVVLINGSTASAAEIVAAALKEQDRAILLGEKSFGKGLVQTIIPMKSGALKLTTSRYYTPSGLSINERGIRPNITVADSAMRLSVDELEKIRNTVLPQHMAIKDPALLKAWQYLNRVTARDQLAMDLNLDEVVDVK